MNAADVKVCPTCSGAFAKVDCPTPHNSPAQWAKRTYCSKLCARKSFGARRKAKWQDPEYRRAMLANDKTIFRKGHHNRDGKPGLKGVASHFWLGEDAGYSAKHSWIRRTKGTPEKCDKCQTSGTKIEWANVDHRYRRDPSDYMALCCACHRRHDIDHGLRTAKYGKRKAKQS